MSHSFSALLVVIALCLGSTQVVADYSAHEKADVFVDDLVENHGFSRDLVTAALSNAERKESILEAISRPAEKTLNWAKYSKIFLTDSRISKGRKFIAKYDAVLQRAEDTYGVPKEIVAAIIGVETRYGENKGSYRVIDALTTLGFDYEPRSTFFTKELKEMFLLAREQGFDVAQLKGSYAGAMGYGQFISSSYRHYAVDFDNDSVADILNNPVDAIGSVANYFKMHKWRSGERVADAVDLEGVDYAPLLYKNLKPATKLAELKRLGYQGFEDTSGDTPLRVLELDGVNGQEQWLTWHNFYVITRYNHSHLYAMAVYQLAKELGL